MPKIKQGHTVYLIGIDDENQAKPMRVFIQNNVTRDWVREQDDANALLKTSS